MAKNTVETQPHTHSLPLLRFDNTSDSYLIGELLGSLFFLAPVCR
jgi:hypothetical protein